MNNILFIILHMPVYISHSTFFVKNDKFRIKCIDKYDASAKGASRKFLDMLNDHRNLKYTFS